MVIQLRLNDDQETCDFLTELLLNTKQITNSKAFILAAKERSAHIEIIENSSIRISELTREVKRLEKIISDLDNACRATLEIIGQGELLK